MNQIIINQEDFDAQSKIATTTNKHAIEHATSILNLSQGDLCKLLILNSCLAEATVKSITKDEIAFEIKSTNKGKEPWLNLYIGLSRPPTCKKILEHATTLGVKSFQFFTTKLSEKSYATSKLWQSKAFEEFLLLGLSQSKNCYKLPQVSVKKSMHELELSSSNSFLLSLNSESWFNKDRVDFSKELNVAIGSERGWTKEEEEYFVNKGFQQIKISDSTMRVEHATIAAISQLEYLLKSS